MNTHILDNAVWHALAGPHARFACGTDAARRYAPGFAPVIGFPDLEAPDFSALIPFTTPGEHLYCDGWSGPAPTGWGIVSESVMRKMIWTAAMPVSDPAPEAILLGAQHAEAALALAALTRPGPFSARTIALGEYVGIVDGTRLVAMAGARTGVAGWSEISGVCTHPDFQGSGIARRLVLKLIRRQLLRGEMPFLRVTRDNSGAGHLYRQMGFSLYRESVARILVRQ